MGLRRSCRQDEVGQVGEEGCIDPRGAKTHPEVAEDPLAMQSSNKLPTHVNLITFKQKNVSKRM